MNEQFLGANPILPVKSVIETAKFFEKKLGFTIFNAQHKEKIFQPFQRLHTDQEFEGTGIGLATVNRVIHGHAGTIWAESIKNEGSCFYFRLQ